MTWNNHNRFYWLMGELATRTGGPTPLTIDECNKCTWPEQGVFFGFEQGETRVNGSPRVVWVATHGDRKGAHTTLRQRLDNHLGYGGKSVLRSHIKSALMKSQGAQLIGKEEINRHLSTMEVLAAYVPGDAAKDTDRVRIKRNSIALLSDYCSPPDSPSNGWLGASSPHPEISRSGLWNVKHVEEECDLNFLDDLESYIEDTPPLS